MRRYTVHFDDVDAAFRFCRVFGRTSRATLVIEGESAFVEVETSLTEQRFFKFVAERGGRVQ